eukprot:XP_001695707.1 predicted protein [Chlamydomonas reinhardtii]
MAYYAGTLKMHKNPPAMRFLACSHACPSTFLADLVTAVLRTVATSFASVWRTQLGTDPWFCLSSSDVIDMAHAYNAHGYSATSHPQAGYDFVGPAAYDFERLYTNIPHVDLCNTISQLLAASLPAGTTGIRASTQDPHPDKPGDPHTHTANFVARVPGARVTSPSASTTHRFFLPHEFMAIFRSLIISIFIRFGPVSARQILGIPMGISPAPFIANLFLAWYGFKFLRQQATTPAAAHAILHRFRFSKRFLDDLSALNNPFLAQLLYTTSILEVSPAPHRVVLHGLYPPCLRLTAQRHHNPTELPFLDILLVSYTTADGKSRITTRLYDKRDQPAFARIRLSRFVAADSSVNEAAKRNILTGQFHRLRRIILDYDNFCLEMARLMRALLDCGYARKRLDDKYAELLAHFPHLYYRDRVALAAARTAYNTAGPPPAGAAHACSLACVAQVPRRMCGAPAPPRYVKLH